MPKVNKFNRTQKDPKTFFSKHPILEKLIVVVVSVILSFFLNTFYTDYKESKKFILQYSMIEFIDSVRSSDPLNYLILKNTGTALLTNIKINTTSSNSCIGMFNGSSSQVTCYNCEIHISELNPNDQAIVIFFCDSELLISASSDFELLDYNINKMKHQIMNYESKNLDSMNFRVKHLMKSTM